MNKVIQNSLTELLYTCPEIDWENFNSWSDQGARILDLLSRDTSLLTEMLENVSRDERLFSMCESHTPFDKIVLFDSDAHRVRIRLHIWKKSDIERAHEHRFCFVTKVLYGSYKHALYRSHEAMCAPVDTFQARDHDAPNRPDETAAPILSELVPVMMTTVKSGDLYALDHSAIHATFPEAGSVSLLLRGPAKKPHAMVADLTQQKVYWRSGRTDEHEDRIADKKMTADQLDAATSYLRQIGLVTNTSVKLA